MRSIALKHCRLGLLLFCAVASALARGGEPTLLQDPVFHLKYDRRVVKFEPIDVSLLRRCGQFSDLPYVTPVEFIFGRAEDDKGRVFYATGGYSIRSNPNPPLTRKYETEGLGLIFFMDGETCHEVGAIKETFEAGAYDDDLTPEVFMDLATDMAARYKKAFNGSEALKLAFKKHRVKRSEYAPELNKAFAPYYVK